jgi:hypothetical protein
MKPFVCAALPALAILISISPARSQSVNIDFGGAESVPPATYGAAGLPGVWNQVGVLPPGDRLDLVDRAGQAIVANIYMIGGTHMLVTDDPSTTGDHQALLDDMLIGFNNPVDVCIWVENLENDDYEVLTYAMTPGDPSLLSSVRVDFGTPGPVMIGGAWPGAHQEGVTFARHTVTVTNGVIALHSGLWDAEVQSGINGIQIRPLSAAGIEGTEASPPAQVALLRAFPNPAAFEQWIEVDLGTSHPAMSLEIWSATGRLVWRRSLPALAAGIHRFRWDGIDLGDRALPAAVYFARLATPSVPGEGPAAATASSLKLIRR